MRLISKSDFTAHSDPLFYHLKKLNIFDIYIIQVAMFVYKSISVSYISLVKPYFSHFQFKPISSDYPLRHILHKFQKSAFRTEIRKNSIMCKGPEILNVLPGNIKDSKSIY